MSDSKQVVLGKDEMKVVTRETLYEVFRQWFGQETPAAWTEEQSAEERAQECMEYLWSKL